MLASVCRDLRKVCWKASGQAWRLAASRSDLLLSKDFTPSAARELVEGLLRLCEGPQNVQLPQHSCLKLGVPSALLPRSSQLLK